MRFAKATELDGHRIAVFVRRATDDCGYLYSFSVAKGRARIGGEGWTAGTRREAIEQAISDAREVIAKRGEAA